ncbi:MAG: hypothetical protein Q9162_006312 [Coniocarpon cinnabarinum]
MLLCLPADLVKSSQQRHSPIIPSKPTRKRKRALEGGHSSLHGRDRDQPPPPKRSRTPLSCAAEEGPKQEAAGNTSERTTNPLAYWIRTGRWHRKYFEQDNLVREQFEKGKDPEALAREALYEKQHQKHVREQDARAMNDFSYLLARKKSTNSLRRQASKSSPQTPSDQLPREAKSAQYRDKDYSIGLEREGSYMRESDLDITNESKSLYQNLLQSEQTIPRDSLFRNDLFKKIFRKIEDRNEAMVIQDITRLIVPSAQNLAIYGATHLNHLYESVNEGWNSANGFVWCARPQPDYSVGFGRSAFADEQLQKLEPFVGSIGSKLSSCFMATSRMYFPFLTCEVKCGTVALDVADRQNAHSMTLAVRGVVELYKLVKRAKELHREILAYSVSHDHRTVRIYGHYALIDGAKTTFYRHPIHEFSFIAQDGKEKWTAYKFTKNVYDIWMPKHLERICSAIDDLPPDINFEVSQQPEASQQSRDLEPLSSQPSVVDSQSSSAASQGVTPTRSFTQPDERAFKKPKKTR